jgi:hypothetical protein
VSNIEGPLPRTTAYSTVVEPAPTGERSKLHTAGRALHRAHGEREPPSGVGVDHDRGAGPAHVADAVAGGEAVTDRRRRRVAAQVAGHVQDLPGVGRGGHDVADPRVGRDRVDRPGAAHGTAATVVPAAGLAVAAGQHAFTMTRLVDTVNIRSA